MPDDYSQFTPAGGSAPAPAYDNSITPEAYFQAVQGIYPNAKFNGGGRTPEHNAAVGGVADSMHLTNQAMDFAVPGVSSDQVFASLKAAGLPMTEELNEGQVGGQGAHLHVGWAPKGQATQPIDNSGYGSFTPAGNARAPATVNKGAGMGTANIAAAQATPNDYSQFTPAPNNGPSDYSQFQPASDSPKPNALEQGIMDFTNNPVVQGLQGAYMHAGSTGLLMQPVRAAMEGLDFGGYKERLQKLFPNDTDDQINARVHNLYNGAIQSVRDQSAQQVQNNPYPGHQIGNFLAGAAAEPEYLAMGGGGVGSTIAKRIATAAAANAGIAGVSDAAAQGMDMLEGQKKNFDVTQSLAAAGTGAILGGVMHGAVEATPFVKGLFGNRGVDTTPGVDPRETGTRDPMTGSSPVMSPEEQVQFKQLLKTGDVDEIKQFLATKQGPKPTFQDVNNLVQLRDNVPPQATNAYTIHDAINSQIDETQRQTVIDHINTQTADWKNAPQFEIINHADEIQDPGIRQQAKAEDQNGDALGFVGHDGVVRVYGNRISDPDQLNALIYHEGLGHFGLSEQFGDKLDSTIQTLDKRNVGQFSKTVDDWQKNNPDAYGGDRTRAAEEVLAEMSQNGQIKPSWQDALTAGVRQFGRKMGLDLSYSDNEIKYILAQAHDAVVNGKGRDVAANGYRGGQSSDKPSQWLNMDSEPTANKNMFTGQHATDFTTRTLNRVRGSDGHLRNEISDENARLIGEGTTLGTTLDHPELYKQYPELRDLPVEHSDILEKQGIWGGYDPHERKMYLDNSAHDMEPLRTALHETQHAIQHIEGHISSNELGSQYSSPEAYANDPIENEARATEARQGMSKAERAIEPAKFMRSDQLKGNAEDRFRNLPIDQINRWKDAGIKDLTQDLDIRQSRLYEFQNYTNQHQELIGDPGAKAKIQRDMIFSGAHGPRFASAMRNDKVGEFMSDRQAELQPIRDRLTALQEARSIQTIRAALPSHIRDVVDHRTAQEQIANSSSNTPKFMRKSQISASQSDYVSDDLDRVYKSLSENYSPTTVSWDETRRAALDAGFKPSQIKDLGETKQGELATRLWRMQSAANMADQEISRLEAKLDTPDWTMTDRSNYVKALSDFHYLSARVKGDRAEYGRALNAAKAARSYSNSTMEQVAERLREQGSGLATLLDDDPTDFLKFARQLKALRGGANTANPKGTMAMMQGVAKPKWEQYLTSLHMNMMLSALSTHVKAPIDMGTGIARDVIEKIIAMPIGKARQAVMTVLGHQPEAGVSVAEISANLYGAMKSVTDAEVYRRMLHAVKTGEGSIVNPDGSVTSTHFNNTYGATSNPRIPGVSLPTDLISAQDTFFRTVEMNKQLYGLGVREAYRQLGKGAKFDDAIQLGSSIARNPSTTMLKEARDLTDRTLLLNNNALNSPIDKYRAAKAGDGPLTRLGKFVVSNLAPFIRVESNNLINRVIQRSPLAILDPYTRAQIAAGGAKADIALARIAYGTTLIGMYWAAAAKGKNQLTGSGPNNVDKYKEQQAGGWTPRSTIDNGRYNQSDSLAMSVNPFDKHNATATMVAAAREAYEEGANKGQVGQALKLALGSMVHSLASMTWVNDLAPAVDALTAKGDSGSQRVNQFIGDEARTWSPNALNQAARLADHNQHDVVDPDSITNTVKNEIQSTIPGASKSLPIHYSVYGNPINNGASLTGVHTVIPGLQGNGRQQTSDPAEMELQRLGSLTQSAVITPVQKTIKLEGQPDPIKLTTPQFEEYQRVAGRAIVMKVQEAMSDPSWQQMSDKDKIVQVRSIQTDMKKAAKEGLFNNGQQ